MNNKEFSIEQRDIYDQDQVEELNYDSFQEIEAMPSENDIEHNKQTENHNPDSNSIEEYLEQDNSQEYEEYINNISSDVSTQENIKELNNNEEQNDSTPNLPFANNEDYGKSGIEQLESQAIPESDQSKDFLDLPSDIMDDNGNTHNNERLEDETEQEDNQLSLNEEEIKNLSSENLKKNYPNEILTNEKKEYIPIVKLDQISESNGMDEENFNKFLEEYEKKAEYKNIDGTVFLHLKTIDEIISNHSHHKPKLDNKLKPDDSSGVHITDPKDIEEQNRKNAKTQESEERLNKDYKKNQPEQNIKNKPQMPSSAQAPGGSSTFPGISMFNSRNRPKTKNNQASNENILSVGKERVNKTYSLLNENLDLLKRIDASDGTNTKDRIRAHRNARNLEKEFNEFKHTFSDKKNYDNSEHIKQFYKKAQENGIMSEKLTNEGKLDKKTGEHDSKFFKKLAEDIKNFFNNIIKKFTKSSPQI